MGNDLRERLARIASELEEIALDEASEVHAYREIYEVLEDEDSREKIFTILFDSILHREIAWAVIRALKCVSSLLSKPAPTKKDNVNELLAEASALEEIAAARYQDLADLAPQGTTLSRLLRLLSEEERKHSALARAVSKKLGGGV